MPLSTFKKFQKSFLPNSLKGKIMVVAFLGTHIPLFGILIFLLTTQVPFVDNLDVLIVALAATLLGMAITIWVISGLLKPVELTSQAINAYITERKLPALPTVYSDEAGELMRNVQISIQQLDDLLTLKSNLISIISHDVKSPITSIIMGLDLIESELSEENEKDGMILKNTDLIRKSTQQQLDILNDLMLAANFYPNDFSLKKEEILLKNLFEELQLTHKLRADTKNITFITDPGDNPDLQLHVDPTKIKSILNNLITNAFKFTPQGGNITLSAQKMNENLHFKVKDSGVGIAASDHEYIFDRSFSTKSPFDSSKGTGLGLWICKEFTELHNGSISLESEKGNGTCFTVSIPVN